MGCIVDYAIQTGGGEVRFGGVEVRVFAQGGGAGVKYILNSTSFT